VPFWHRRLAMIRAMRRNILTTLLALVLAVTSVGFGHARGAAPAAGAMVICRGQTVIRIVIDASGQPVETRHICPDAVLFVAAGPAPLAVPALDEGAGRLSPSVTAVHAASLAAITPRERGPPRVV
jgi:hypothetical protein